MMNNENNQLSGWQQLPQRALTIFGLFCVEFVAEEALESGFVGCNVELLSVLAKCAGQPVQTAFLRGGGRVLSVVGYKVL